MKQKRSPLCLINDRIHELGVQLNDCSSQLRELEDNKHRGFDVDDFIAIKRGQISTLVARRTELNCLRLSIWKEENRENVVKAVG